MSAGRGSISINELGQEELYRGSKAALNMFMRSYAARHTATPHPIVAMAPGWVRTDLDGPNGRLSIEESISNLVNVLLAKLGRPVLEYLDYLGHVDIVDSHPAQAVIQGCLLECGFGARRSDGTGMGDYRGVAAA